MSDLPTMNENPSGLHQRYLVSKANGDPVDLGAIYFVMRLDSGGSDKEHIDLCRRAVLSYASSIIDENVEHLVPLAVDLVKLISDQYDAEKRSPSWKWGESDEN